ncbi:hypothetical protein HELRODRAFT_158755 [Helobdella robusta]|uniref:Endonuclease/exonuclease/phosphatase domain-containing protein n=1 Tax=Helobdella robusta TaxID=6412 RepID=T1EN77_HELRO|nr:hypothetical protein HELRODRAFT_158755 [Helobdella robusta]ESO12274.1 hypothetical protein HELRODRAFT_158755 [Helobdella robusta]
MQNPRCYKCGGGGGSVVILLRKSYRSTEVDLKFQPKSFECLCVSMLSNSSMLSNIVTLAIYRLEPIDEQFFTEIRQLFELLTQFNGQIVIFGDLNIHLEDPTNAYVSSFKLLLSSFSCTQHIDSSTHRMGGQLDVISTRSEYEVFNVQVKPHVVSDHGLISCSSSAPDRSMKYSMFRSTRTSFQIMGSFHARWLSLQLLHLFQPADVFGATKR